MFVVRAYFRGWPREFYVLAASTTQAIEMVCAGVVFEDLDSTEFEAEKIPGRVPRGLEFVDGIHELR